MKDDRTWLIKMENAGKHALTLFDDGYVKDEKGKKTFVLQKAAMEMVRSLVDEYSTGDDGTADDPKLTIKCNVDHIYVSHNYLFYNQMKDLLFKSSSIKHPPKHFDDVISEIERLRSANELDDMIERMGRSSFICYLIDMFCEVENN